MSGRFSCPVMTLGHSASLQVQGYLDDFQVFWICEAFDVVDTADVKESFRRYHLNK